MNHTPCKRGGARRQAGLSLVELMIAMVLGLLVTGSAIGVFLSNQQTYRSTESLARIQESARVAFELMAREMREAAGNACSRNLPVANVLNDQTQWWAKWQEGLVGYDNGALPASAAGTDAVDLIAGASGSATVTELTKNAAELKVNTNNHGFEDFDILIVCDYTQASIFQATNVNSSNVTVVHNTGTVGSGPGNCSKALGLPLPKACPGGDPSSPEVYKLYGPNSQVIKLKASRWYVADNGRGGRSLYRVQLDKGNNLPAEEITEGVHDLQIEYLVDGAAQYVAAAAGLDWSRVTAIRVRLGLQGGGKVGTDGNPLQRRVEHVVNLRNRTT